MIDVVNYNEGRRVPEYASAHIDEIDKKTLIIRTCLWYNNQPVTRLIIKANDRVRYAYER
jgi:hypothetical protein